MSGPRRQKPQHLPTRIVFWALAAGMVLLAGCGSVGDIGMGASRSGVQPVRGTYGASSYNGLAGDTEQRVETLARPNRKGKKEAAALKTLKALPEASSDAVATVTGAERPAVTDEVKVAIRDLERTTSRASRSRDSYGASRVGSRGRDYDDY